MIRVEKEVPEEAARRGRFREDRQRKKSVWPSGEVDDPLLQRFRQVLDVAALAQAVGVRVLVSLGARLVRRKDDCEERQNEKDDGSGPGNHEVLLEVVGHKWPERTMAAPDASRATFSSC